METNEQTRLAWDIIETTNTNLFLTGKAGTGKTTFLRRLRRESSKRIIVLAPTGIAAINAEGVTIHSFFQLPFAPYIPEANYKLSSGQFRFSKDKIRIIRSIDTLVIDEISMVRADLLDAVDHVLRRFRRNNAPFGGVQMLLIGDLGQLAPVAKDEEWTLLSQYYDTPYFFSSVALRKSQFAMVELTHVYRQTDTQFLEILNRVRDNRADREVLSALNNRYIPNFKPREEEGYIRLTTHNAQAQRINDSELAALPGKAFIYEAKISGKFPDMLFPTDRQLILKKGAQVMFVKNDSSAAKRYYNGMIGRISEISSDGFSVIPKGSDAAIKVESEEWNNSRYVLNKDTREITEEVDGVFKQFPVKAAWAITVHKSQGLTFDKAIIDVQFAFSHGQTYVALSRCRTLEGLVLSAPLPESAIIRDGAIDSFIAQASQHVPTNDTLKTMQRDFFMTTVSSLFSFHDITMTTERMMNLLNSNFRRNYPKLIVEYKARFSILKKEVFDVAEKFNTQYVRLILTSPDYANDAALQERLKKGAAYFARSLYDMVTLADNTRVETSNDVLRTRTTELVASLREMLKQKCELLAFVKQNGFSLLPYLHQRAMVLAGQDEGKPQRGTAKTATRKKKEAPSTPGDPKLLEALTAWRREKMEEMKVPAYCILRQETLMDIAASKPHTAAQLLECRYMGKAKLEKYGGELLDIVRDYTH